MAIFPSSFDIKVLKSPSGSSSRDSDQHFEESCSICLEPFTTDDPSTATNCQHEYHLQCIIEWSQRSKECPICWQLFSMKDPSSQEIIAMVESERSLRSGSHISVTPEEFKYEHDAPYADDSDFNERIILHLASPARRDRFMSRRERHRFAGFNNAHDLLLVPPSNAHNMHQTNGSPQRDQNSGYGSLSESDSPTSRTPTSIYSRSSSDAFSSVINMMSSVDDNREGLFKSRVYSHPLPNSPARSCPTTNSPSKSSTSELLSMSESIKSKVSAASARYKESISKNTKGLKEKLLARNNSVKELRKGVQREMSVGIASLARMFGRLDPMSKQNDLSVSVSNCHAGTSDFSYKGKDVQQNVTVQTPEGKNDGISDDVQTPHVSTTIHTQLEVSCVQEIEV